MFNTRTILYVLTAILLFTLYKSCSSGHHSAEAAHNRPNDPWIFRSVMDKQPRMVTLSLDDNLWASYSTDSCSLYKIWKGGVNFEGAVYNLRHGPQPSSFGNAWFLNTHKAPWFVTVNGKKEPARADYKGHRYTADGRAELMYDIYNQSGQKVARVNESPEYVNENHQPGFERRFKMENAAPGVLVSLKFNAGSIVNAHSGLKCEGGKLQIISEKPHPAVDLTAVDAEAELELAPDGTTRLTNWFVNQPLFENPNAALQTEEENTLSPGERLVNKNDCRTCHNAQYKTVGPSYVDIANRYKNTVNNIEMLTKKVISGGSGTWGQAAMSAHPDLQPEQAKSMVAFVLSLDEGEDDGLGGDSKKMEESSWFSARPDVNDREIAPGLLVDIWEMQTGPKKLNDVPWASKPGFSGLVGNLYAGYDDFGKYKNNFALRASGFLFLEKDKNVVLRLASDDGSRLWIDDKLVFDNDGLHGAVPNESEVGLKAGYHAIKMEYMQAGGGRGLFLSWTQPGSADFQPISSNYFVHNRNVPAPNGFFGKSKNAIPGDLCEPTAVHPAYKLTQARPAEFLPKVAGMDFLSDGRLVVSTWDPVGGVYILENVNQGDPSKIKVKQIAKGLAEPLGLKVVNDTIYVLQKQELTQLIDLNGDEIADEYRCFAKGWRASANFHEFAFGLAYKDGYFYAALAIAIMPGGASARPQIPDRGKVIKISKKDGSIEFIARGLRTPNGIGIGTDGELFVADNQGDWLPASKILHVKQGAFYNSYAVDSLGVAGMPISQPVVWLPQDEIGNSPSTPIELKDGPYKGQMIHGDVCHGGIKRVFVEKVNGDYQGCVFRWIQGLEAGVNRICYSPDGALFVGGIGNPGNWGQEGKLWYGLQRLEYQPAVSVFEMLAVRAKSNGIEVEFTEPLPLGTGWSPADYDVKQWWLKPTFQYGGPKMDEEALKVLSANVSPDRKKVFIEIQGMKPQHIVYLRLLNHPLSDLGHEIWTTETWYTLNTIPADQPGERTTAPAPVQYVDNTLTEKEKAEGWSLLFDGSSMKGWHNYAKNATGKSWIIDENSIHLDAKPNPDGHWQAPDGGDILTDEVFENFELTLDWKIAPCGNSGIIYFVQEDPKYNYVWQTGPEMQVLDNACHPDSKYPKHRAGDLYDLIECSYVTVKPAGEWNHIRLISKNGHVEHWLNNRKLVEYEQGSEQWWKLIAGSKFKDMPGFGRARSGKIALQDHGDPVWYKNVKIKKL